VATRRQPVRGEAKSLAGKRSRYFPPPGGDRNDRTKGKRKIRGPRLAKVRRAAALRHRSRGLALAPERKKEKKIKGIKRRRGGREIGPEGGRSPDMGGAVWMD